MKRKKMSNLKKVLLTFFLLILIWIFIFYLYTTYKNIEIDESNYIAERTESTIEEQTVEKVQENSQNIADMIEETTEKIVGISKLKNTGSSILNSSDESQLGLGTGIIISENGYILSNEHVTGEKYSKCYVTLENGNNYEGKVVWSDKEIDLSITKIEAKNLKYVSLGDSDNTRVGETVYAIRKSNTDTSLEEQ